MIRTHGQSIRAGTMWTALLPAGSGSIPPGVTQTCRLPRSGLFAALLALAAQLAFAASVPQPVLLALGFTPICHAGRPGRIPARRLPPARAVSPLCLALALPAAPLAAAPRLPVPRVLPRVRVRASPPPESAPAPYPLAAAPRGPPTRA